MFDFTRKHTKLIMVVLFLLIIPSFVLFGIDGYTRMNPGAGKVAEVNGQAITQTDWDNALRAEADRLRQANPALPAALLDAPEFKRSVLDRLVRSHVLAAAAQDQHLQVSDARLIAWLQQLPALADLRRPDGSLNAEAYRQFLARQGLTPEAYEASVRADLTTQQVMSAVLDSSFAAPAQTELALNALREQRQARVAQFKPADYTAQVKVSDQDLQAWYDAHKAQYQAPETIDVEYLVLDLPTIAQGITVSDQDLRTYYEQNSKLLGAPEQRSASHILIASPNTAPAADREKAKAQAQQLLEQLRQNPERFAELARQHSADEASAANGGELGQFERDKGMDPAIAQAAFGLKNVGDISEPVSSEFGWHLVKLTGITPSAVPPFEQVRGQLAQQLRDQEAQKQFSDLADEFGNLVYEQPDSLQAAADKLKLSIQTERGLTRQGAAANSPLANEKLLNALFSADAIGKKRNTEAINLGDNRIASGRVIAHNPAHALPFEQVKDQVRQAYVQEQAARLAREAGQASLAKWNAQPSDASGLSAPLTLARNSLQGQSPRLVEAVLRADPAKLPAFVGTDLGPEGYAIAQVEKVLPLPALAASDLASGQQQYEQTWALAEASRYYDYLHARYKARVLVNPSAGSATAP